MANEKRLIDASAFLEHWNNEYRHRFPCDMYKVAIANFPTVDAVEVVRCKDCKYRAKSYVRDFYYCSNPHHGLSAVAKLKDYDFCSYGERREGE